MENFINLKYEKWVKSGKYGLNSLEDYISLLKLRSPLKKRYHNKKSSQRE